MADLLVLNALLNALMAEGDTFDPGVALELFASVPEQKVSCIPVRFSSRTQHEGAPYFDEIEEKILSIGAGHRYRGLVVGKWLLTRQGLELFIDPDLPLGMGVYYVLQFKKGTCRSFLEAHPVTVSIPLFFNSARLRFGWYRFRTWKTPLLHNAD